MSVIHYNKIESNFAWQVIGKAKFEVILQYLWCNCPRQHQKKSFMHHDVGASERRIHFMDLIWIQTTVLYWNNNCYHQARYLPCSTNQESIAVLCWKYRNLPFQKQQLVKYFMYGVFLCWCYHDLKNRMGKSYPINYFRFWVK